MYLLVQFLRSSEHNQNGGSLAIRGKGNEELDLAQFAQLLDGILAFHATSPKSVPYFTSRPVELTAIERRPSEQNSALVCFGAQNQWQLRCMNRKMLEMSNQSIVQLLKNRHHVVYQWHEKQTVGPDRLRTVIVIPAAKGCYALVAEAHPKTE